MTLLHLRVFLHEQDWVDKTILARSTLPDCIEIVKIKNQQKCYFFKSGCNMKKTKHYEDFLYHSTSLGLYFKPLSGNLLLSV